MESRSRLRKASRFRFCSFLIKSVAKCLDTQMQKRTWLSTDEYIMESCLGGGGSSWTRISHTWLAQETLDSATGTGRAKRKQLLWSCKQKTSVSEVYREAVANQGHGPLHVFEVGSNLLHQVREFGAYQGLIVTRWS